LERSILTAVFFEVLAPWSALQKERETGAVVPLFFYFKEYQAMSSANGKSIGSCVKL
jgi:hypothetical protein